MSDLVSVKEIDARKGRGLIANVDLEGDVNVFTVKPDITVLYSQHTATTCVLCYRRADDAAYCCPQCHQFAICQSCLTTPAAEARKEAHLLPCQWMTLLPAETQRGDTDYLRFVLEYAARVQNGDTRLLMALDTLCTNADSTAADTRDFCESFSRLTTTKFQPHGMLVSQPQLQKLLLQTKSNSVGFPFTEKETLGWSLQEEICMLNHSCQPNCAIVEGTNEDKGSMRLQTLKPIAAEEELTISYVDMSGPLGSDVQGRTRELLERYRFLCQCGLCQEQRNRK